MPTAKENLESFVKSIEEYKNNLGVFKKEFSEDFDLVNSIDMDSLERLTQKTCFNYAFILFDFAAHLQSEINGQKVALEWCKNAINHILVVERENYYDDDWWRFTPYDVKIKTLASQNSYIDAVQRFKEIAQSRIQSLEGTEQLVRKKAECLMEKGKRS